MRLNKACRYGEISILKKALNKNTDINIILKLIETACENGHLHIVKYLIERNEKNNNILDIDFRHNMFVLVCYKEYYNISKYLLKYCEKHSDCGQIYKILNDTLYSISKYKNHIIKYIINFYIQNKYDVLNNFNNSSLFLDAYIKGQTEIVKYLIDYYEKNGNRINIIKYNDYIFRYAYKCGKIDILKYIIEYSEKINNRINIYLYQCIPGEKIDTMRNISFINICKYVMYLHKHNYNLKIKDLIVLKEHNELFIRKYNRFIYDKCVCNNIIISYCENSYGVVCDVNINYFICLCLNI